MIFTKHARDRNQQRVIPPIVHAWLDTYGAEKTAGHGACVIHFDKKGVRRMEADLGKRFVRENKKYLKVYRVEAADGLVFTTGYRDKRIKV